MKKLSIMALMAMAGGVAQANDTLSVKVDSLYSIRYSVAVKDAQITNEEGFSIAVGNQRGRGSYIHINKNQIWGYNGKDSTLIADGLPQGEEKHSYKVIKNSKPQLNIFRDDILVGTTTEGNIGKTNFLAVIKGKNLAEGYQAEVLSTYTAELPDEKSSEQNISNMLPDEELTNLIGDPYCNHGFDRTGLNAETRSFYTNAASFTGWGPEATIDTQNAYSGAYCIKLSGQAAYPDKGASLDFPVSMKANSAYLVRVMVKSEGYTGKLGINEENSYLPINDTKGEWKQLEGVVTTGSKARTMLYINNEGFDNTGTVYFDNFEVYETYTLSSQVPSAKSQIAGVKLRAGEVWSPQTAKEVYWINFKQTETTACSEINSETVILKGSVSYTRPVKGSQLYALNFPGDLQSMTLTGYYDRFNYVNEPLTFGLDYLVLTYDAPRFHYADENQAITSGCYLVQFVDNINGLEVTMNFAGQASGTPQTGEYRMVGNPTFATYQPEGTFLKFNEEKGYFERTVGESIAPFEAYIATTATTPVGQIVPNGTISSFKRLTTTEGQKISILSTREGVTIHAKENTSVSIYSISGALIDQIEIIPGSNSISLPKGFYLIEKQKVVVY